MRRKWLAGTALAAVAVSVPVAGVAGSAQAATFHNGQQKIVASTTHKRHKSHKKKQHRPKTFDQRAAALARTLIGDPYAWGGTTPAGFDCSGLTQYVYRHLGKRVQRTAEDQFLQFRQISERQARPGDLVFFHVDSYPGSYVYHVGVYEGHGDMVAATTYGQGVQFQSYAWAGDTITFGTITH